jgi:hypothetical protein
MKRWTEADLVRSFDRMGNSPAFWREHARELLNSSRALLDLWDEAIQYDPPTPREALDYDGPAIMLRAMAFECLLKARALEQGVVLARDGRYVKVPGVRNHDLAGLARAANFDVTPKEGWVLRRLSRWITGGRYPIQQKWTDQTRLTKEGLMEPLCAGWHPAWDDLCDALSERLVPEAAQRSTQGNPLDYAL